MKCIKTKRILCYLYEAVSDLPPKKLRSRGSFIIELAMVDPFDTASKRYRTVHDIAIV